MPGSAESLDAVLAQFDPTLPLAEARTPPASWYTDPRVAEAELQTVFAVNWLPAARTEHVEKPGSFVAQRLAQVPVVVTRDEQSRLHALVNVCRHRAAEVATGCGHAQRLVCNYHGWEYALDGRLQRAPELGGVANFDRYHHALPELAVETWGRWVMATLGSPALPLRPSLDVLEQRLADFGYRHLTHVATRRYELACNWKVFVDNYLDGGYHVATLHRGLAAQLDLADYRTELFDRFSIQSCGSNDCPANTAPSTDFSERVAGGALYAWVYPNWMLNRYGPILDTNIVWPLGPDRCEVVFDYFFTETEGDAARDFIERSIAASDAVQQEDVAICESVQRGLASGHYHRGPYSLRRESPQYHFHQLLHADLTRQDPRTK